MSRLVDAYALADFLKVKPAIIRKWAHQGHITRRGTRTRGYGTQPVALYDPDEVLEYATTRGILASLQNALTCENIYSVP